MVQPHQPILRVAMRPTLKVIATAIIMLALHVPVNAQDHTVVQGFYWDVTPGGVWYDSLAARADYFGQIGVDGVWFPPPSKGAAGGMDVGYTPYDYYDVGEYNSAPGNGTSENGSAIPTRYGTREGLERVIQLFKAQGIESYADAVLNHRSGGVLEPNQYIQWFTNPGGSLYSERDSTYTAFPLEYGSGRIAWDVGDGNEYFFPNASNNPGNTGDFYSDSQLSGYFQLYTNGFGYDVALHDGFGNNLPVGDSLMIWGNWLVDEVGFDGFRVDFVKGIHPEYLKRFADYESNRGKYVVAELYDGSLDRLKNWLTLHSGTEKPISIFDFNLRFAYKEWSDNTQGYDIRNLHGRGLVNTGGVAWEQIAHFVDNHDFDRNDFTGNPSQEGHSPVINQKELMYAHMMAMPGTAYIWYKDMYWYGLRDQISLLSKVRDQYISGSYEILTNRGDVNWPGNASNDARHVMVIQRGGDSDETGAIVAINKSNDFDINVWVTSSKWAGQRLIDITGNSSDTLDVLEGDLRVQIRTKRNSFHVFVPVGSTLEIDNNVAVQSIQGVRDGQFLGEQIAPSVTLKSEALLSQRNIEVRTTLIKPDASAEVLTQTLPLLKAYDELTLSLDPQVVSQVGTYTLGARIFREDSNATDDSLAVTFSVNDTTGAARFRMDGQFSEASYELLIERESDLTGFGENKVIDAIYYGFFQDTLYFGLQGSFPTNEADGIGLVLDVSGKSGLPAGTDIGKTEGATGFLNPADATNAASRYDFEADYAFSFLGASANSLDASVVNFTQETPTAFRLEAVSVNGSEIGLGPQDSTVIHKEGMRYAVDFSAGDRKGIEIALAKDALFDGAENLTEDELSFRLFAFVVSGTAYYSNVTIPGNFAGTTDSFGNPGFNTDYSTDSGGPFHSSFYLLNGRVFTSVEEEKPLGLAEGFRILGNYPNPFNPTTTIEFEASSAAPIKLQVMNVLGQTVATLVDRSVSAGRYQQVWNATHHSSGMYFIRLETPTGVQTRKMILLK